VVSDFFSQQSELTPDVIAVQDGSRALCYRQLDQQSNALARQLRARGINCGDRIGICVNRGVDLAIAVLATLKVGAAYVPLDPSYPIQRLNMMVGDSAARLVLASSEHRRLFDDGTKVLTMEEIQGAAGEVLPPPGGPMRDDQLAYIIYTSGSTGAPKGVAMPHRALVNLIQWQLQQPGLAQPVRVVQFTPLSFDVHFQEFFSTWASGGTLFFIAEETRRDPVKLLAFIIEHAIERLFLPFVALQQLLEVAVSYGPLPTSLKDVITAGEQLQINRFIAEFFRQSPHCRLHNHYGPSETHVVTAYTLPSDVASWPTLPAIGRAIDNTDILILDQNLQAVSAGDSGELCISGQCLASGYWQRPELTAQRFIQHPLVPTGRLYRSGDLARLGSDGNIEYLGRIDGQVKIRGHRVETGEVESHIKQHPELRDCAVIASEGSGGDRRLFAYLVLDAKPQGNSDPRQRQQLSQWQDVWDGTYEQGDHAADSRFDISGWNSSYTSQPLAVDDMRQWVDATVERIIEGKPRRVLEIGAGTGLILFGLAPHCDYYHATDYSSVSIARLQQQLAAATDIKAEMKASVLVADQLLQLQGEQFDTVVLNSVSQHFVSVEYLIEVVRQACQLLQRGGRIFVGDITSLNTRALFFTTVECYKARAAESTTTLRARIQRRLGEEQELVLEPALFYRLAEDIDAIRAVSVQLKPGRYQNELSQFRYDVVLEVGTQALGEQQLIEQQQQDWLQWNASLSLADIRKQLESAPEQALGIRGVPNARLQYAGALAHCLQSGEHQSLAEVEAAANTLSRQANAVHPDDFLTLQQSHHQQVQLLWSRDPARFDVLLCRAAANIYHRPALEPATTLANYASQPFNTTALPYILSELRRDLALSLPDYMQPARYLLLQRLPLTPSGKLDRRALPQPSSQRPTLEQEYVAPQGELETALAAIWAELLELDQIGVNDNFFDLGGNSILSLRLGLEIRRRLARDLAVVTLFQFPTVRALATHLADPAVASGSLAEAAKSRAQKQKQAFARGRRLAKVSNR
jgi:amino acid adenylation domain-containing protein